MTVITPIRSVLVPTGLHFSSGATVDTPRGTKIVKDLKIFKVGTFKDSQGVQRTWTAEQLQQMVFNFNELKQNRQLDPPARKGHPGIFGSGGEVVGYIDDVRSDNAFLYGDIEFTEPDAYAKYSRGTYRARSLEVGLYETNDEVPYWPTVMGVAFVDIGAVEGLYSLHQGAPEGVPSKMSFAMTLVDEERNSHMPTAEELAAAQAKAEADQAKADADAAAATAAQAKADADLAAAQAAQAAADVAAAAAAALKAEADTALAAAHAAASGGSVTFQVAGQATNDFAAVQAHIAALETFQSETVKNGRESFVKKLSEDRKIAATQVENLTALALSFSPEQFKNFCASYESAPRLSLFGQQSDNGGDGNQEGAGVLAEVDVLKETIAMHRRAGMTEDQIEKLASYKRLQSLITT